MPDLATAYTETRDRLVELVRPLDELGLAAIVPATPAWTIKDVVAHVTHVAGAYATGHHSYSSQDVKELAVALRDDLPDIDRWSQDGVDERRGCPLGQIIHEWLEQTTALCVMMAGGRPLPADVSRDVLAWAAVSDLATHAQDVRGALGLEPDREAYATKLAYASFTMMLEVRAATADVPPLRIVTERGEVSIGASADPRTIEVDWYELLRATAGRRSVHQIRHLFAPRDAGPYLGVISPYPLPVESLAV
jgi:uncharacterized protein (TIGR03083 family)